MAVINSNPSSMARNLLCLFFFLLCLFTCEYEFLRQKTGIVHNPRIHSRIKWSISYNVLSMIPENNEIFLKIENICFCKIICKKSRSLEELLLTIGRHPLIEV